MKKFSKLVLMVAAIMVLNQAATAQTTDSEWTTLPGKAQFTDAFTYILAGAGETAETKTWEVTIQQNNADPTMYRLVNPYENWENPYSASITYDATSDNSLVFYILEEEGKAYFLTFNTGLNVEGKGAFGTATDITYMMDFYDIDFMLSSMPDAFGEFKDGVFTYSATYLIEGWDFPTMYGWYNVYDPFDYDNLYPVNEAGTFKIVLPSDDTATGITQTLKSEKADAEYYDVRGARIANPRSGQLVIEKKGNSVKKVVF